MQDEEDPALGPSIVHIQFTNDRGLPSYSKEESLILEKAAQEMQIRSNTYPVRFDRVDNPLEAMASPSADAVSNMVTGQMLNRTPVVDVFNRIQAPDGTETQVNYRLEKTFQGLRISGHAGDQALEETVLSHPMGLQVQGRIGNSQDQMRIDTLMGGFGYSGQVGDVPVRQQLGLNPWTLGFQLTGHFGSVALHLAGQPDPRGQVTHLQGTLDGRPMTGSIRGGNAPDTILLTRQVDGYNWLQEIRPQAQVESSGSQVTT